MGGRVAEGRRLNCPLSICNYSAWTMRMMIPGYLLWCLELFFLVLPATGRTIPVFWNSSNTMFDPAMNANYITVHEGDSINFMCPYYTGNTVNQSDWEYYTIYHVSKQSYDMCVINNAPDLKPVITCNRPQELREETKLVLAFNPQPNGIDFHTGRDHYFISTSGGKEGNIGNQFHGACKLKNMKLVVQCRVKDTSGNTGSDNNNNNNNGGGNDNEPDPPRTQPTVPPTVRRTTTTTTTTAPTPRPRVSTAAPTQPPTRPRPVGGGSNTGGDGSDEPIPGSDGFPNDNTVIHAPGGDRGRPDGPINSGVIDDSGAADFAVSLHSSPVSLSRHCTVCVSLVITFLVVSAILRGR